VSNLPLSIITTINTSLCTEPSHNNIEYTYLESDRKHHQISYNFEDTLSFVSLHLVAAILKLSKLSIVVSDANYPNE
jgi:hypothetical protein